MRESPESGRVGDCVAWRAGRVAANSAPQVPRRKSLSGRAHPPRVKSVVVSCPAVVHTGEEDPDNGQTLDKYCYLQYWPRRPPAGAVLFISLSGRTLVVAYACRHAAGIAELLWLWVREEYRSLWMVAPCLASTVSPCLAQQRSVY